MNKALILKYKTEFDYWLNGGNVQAFYKQDDEPKWWSDKESINYGGVDNFSYVIDKSLSPEDVMVVIDDEYVKFRKALAEGRTIQCNAKEGENDITYTAYRDTWWVDTTEFKYATRFYRIKPEEPNFKVGDWVVNKTSKQRIVKKITSIYSDSVTVGNTEVGINVMLINDLELWQPQPGEWCWYSKWDKIVCVESYLCKYALDMNEVEPEYKHKYEPFIGQLPSYLKE